MGRAPCCDKANVKKGPWSPEEDAKLKSYIEKHGTGGNWIALPQKIGLKRCGKSCRLRWLNYLRPNIKHGGFTEDEDNLICSLYISIGSRWSIIAAQLPGRTDNDIKNYWNTRLKKKLLGKQRREHKARSSSTTARKFGTGQGCDESYPIKESSGFYPRPQPPLAPPLPPGYTNENSYSATNTLIDMPRIEADFCYDRRQPNDQGKLSEAFHSISHVSCDQNQQMGRDSSCTSFMNPSCPPLMKSDVEFNLAAFDHGISEEGAYASMPRLFDGVDGFSAIDLVNSSKISSSSLENTSWGDTSSVHFYPSAVTNYEISHQEMPQYCALFDEPRLLDYSQ